MNAKKSIVALGLALVITGAGCSKGAKDAEKTSEETVASAPGITVTTTTDAAETTATPALSATADATWQTYTSRDGSWKFLWPTKGSMAPRWEADIASETKDGCYGEGEQRRVKLGDAEFCHTGTRASGLATDHYVTKRGEQYVRLTFTKKGGDTFDWSAYSAFLDQVVGTFKSLK
jgi:hypothetical protein